MIARLTWRFWLVLAAVAGFTTATAVWIGDRAGAPDPVLPGQADPGEGSERCVQCHAGQTPPDSVHTALPCVSCHLGDPAALTEEAAHTGLEREPGALDSAAQTCGQCHPRELSHVRSSLMTTGSGIIAGDRFGFGLPTDEGHQRLAEVLADESPAPVDDHLRRLCAGCHLGTREANRDDAIRSPGSGCSACHLGPGPAPGTSNASSRGHPEISAVPSDARCFGCHSRSARVSLSYQGLAEVKGHPCPSPERLPDGRPVCRIEADVHHSAGLSCVDCHLHTEVMGDGTPRRRQHAQLELACEDCHGPTTRTTTWGRARTELVADILRLRGEARPDDEAVRVARRGTPLWNLRPRAPAQAGGAVEWWLQPKAGGQARRTPPTPEDANHRLAGHERLTCASCHSGWAPVCADCHTAAVPEASQWDFGRSAEAPGAWRETSERFAWGPPALGVVANEKIAPAIPGMVMTLDGSKVGGPRRDLRAYAVLDPHTTRAAGRSCASCHRDAWSLGLGAGRLVFGPEAVRFEPAHPGPDGLASDRWTTLLAASPGTSSRPEVRSLDAMEQRRVLAVGSCVVCHADASDDVYGISGRGDFRKALAEQTTGSCPGYPPPALE